MKHYFLYIFILIFLIDCRKDNDIKTESDSETIFEGYVKNKITNEPLTNAAVWLEVEYSGGGSWIVNPDFNSNSLKNNLQECSYLTESPIPEISTRSDTLGYYSVKASSKVKYLTGSYFKNDIMADFSIRDFKQKEINKIDILVDCPAHFYPTLISTGPINYNDSVKIWMLCNGSWFKGSETNPYLVMSSYGSYPYGDREVLYKIGCYHINKWIYTKGSVYIKSFVQFRDTIRYNNE
jgi:hypothetical protein